MNNYHQYIEKYPELRQLFKVSFGFLTSVNRLIILHVSIFLVFLTVAITGLLDMPFANVTFADYMQSNLTLKSGSHNLQLSWITGIFTYEFIANRVAELILSMSMLWFFGRILQEKMEQGKIVKLYFLVFAVSAVVFYLSHLIFPVLSGSNGILHGSFCGVLGIMTTAITLSGNRILKSIKGFDVRLWHVYALATLLSFVFVYENSLAYVFVCFSSIGIGVHYAAKLGNTDEIAMHKPKNVLSTEM